MMSVVGRSGSLDGGNVEERVSGGDNTTHVDDRTDVLGGSFSEWWLASIRVQKLMLQHLSTFLDHNKTLGDTVSQFVVLQGA